MPHGSIRSKSAQVDGHVERDAVVADAALDAEAERADLARVAHRPDRTSSPGGRRAGRPPTPSAAQVATRAASSARTSGRTSRPRSARRDDRVRHQLARAVVGHLAAALDPDDLDAAARRASPRRRRTWAGSDVAAEGQDRRVLEEEQLVADRAVGALRREALLERQSVAVVGRVRAMTRRSAPVRGRPAPIRESASRSPRPHDSRTWSADRPGRPARTRRRRSGPPDRGQAGSGDGASGPLGNGSGAGCSSGASYGSNVKPARRKPAHSVEFEGVALVGLVGQGCGLRVRRPTGRGAGLGPAVPEAERHASAVVRGRALEVVDEARPPPSPRDVPSRRRRSGDPRPRRVDGPTGRPPCTTRRDPPDRRTPPNRTRRPREGSRTGRRPGPDDRSGSAIDVSCRCSIANCSRGLPYHETTVCQYAR